MNRLALRSLLFVVTLSACSPPKTRPEDEAALEEGDFLERGIGPAQDSAAVPMLLGSDLSAELTPSSQRYVFSFTLSAPARVQLRTTAGVGGAEVDTVLALYAADAVRRTRRKIAENDDANGSRFSLLERELPAADYLLEVRGYRARTRGAFTLTSACLGPGCPVLPEPCPFGQQFSDLLNRPDLTVVSERMITRDAQLTTDVQRAQLVVAVQQSSHTDVHTPSEALSRVDQQEIRQLDLRQQAGNGTYTVYEYGVGDNSYGAIFAAQSLSVLASIHDGDLINCPAPK